MNKIIKRSGYGLIFIMFLIGGMVLAATNDFTADGDITVTGVTFGTGTTDIIIFNGSTAESWSFSSGTFTITNPGTFKVGSSDSNVKSFKVYLNGSVVACEENTTPGTSYITLPTDSGTYTVEPSTLTDCTNLCSSITGAASYNSYPTCGAASCSAGYTLVGSGSSAGCCQTIDHAASYNSYPTCGAASCDSGYILSGSGSSATCIAGSSGSSFTFPSQTTETTYQIYDSTTGELLEGEAPSGVEEEKEITSEGEEVSGEIVKKENEGVFIDREKQLEQITNEASIISVGDIEIVLTEVKAKRDLALEREARSKYVNKLFAKEITKETIADAITNFIVYGTESTNILGAGERAGVLNSYKSTFGKLPETESEWRDCIAIANGRWPKERNEEAEAKAEEIFKKIYLREPNRSNPHDDAAVIIIAYGLRPTDRNLNSEKKAINIFKAIYNYNPSSARDWDIVRAIAYSGATR